MSRIKEMILDDIVSKFMKGESMDELKLLFYNAHNKPGNGKDIIVNVNKISNTVFVYDIENDLYITRDDDIENIKSLSSYIRNSLDNGQESEELDFRSCEMYYNTDIKSVLMEYSLTRG